MPASTQAVDADAKCARRQRLGGAAAHDDELLLAKGGEENVNGSACCSCDRVEVLERQRAAGARLDKTGGAGLVAGLAQ